MATDRELLRLSEKGRMGSVGLTDVEGTVNAMNQRTLNAIVNVAAHTSGTASATFALAVLDRAIKVVSARFISAGATTITASSSQYVTVQLSKNDDAGGSATVLASQSTITSASGGTGNITQNQSKALTLSSTVTASSGDQLRVRYLQTGGGKLIGAGSRIVVVYQEV